MTARRATIPPDGRGRPPRHDWASIPVGGQVIAGGGSGAHWGRKLGRTFVTRGRYQVRVK